MKTKLVTIGLALFTSTAFAAPNSFNFSGVLLDSSSIPVPNGATLTFQIYNPGASCLLYEETQTPLIDANGNFSAQVGGGSVTGNNPGLIWNKIFQNVGVVRATASPNCSPGYTAAVADGRLLRVSVNGTALTPDFPIGSVPMATVADNLSPFSTIPGDLTIGNAGNLGFANSGFTVSLKAPASLTNNVPLILPSMLPASNGQVLTSTTTGDMYWSTPGGGGSVSSVSVGAGLQASPTTITTSGTISLASIPAGTVMANFSGSPAAPSSAMPGQILDQISSTTNSMLFRGASSWQATPSATTGTVPYFNGSTFSWMAMPPDFSTGAMPMTGQLRPMTGSAASPGIAVSGTTTGLFDPGSAIGFSVGGTEKMRLSGTGKVGIGSTAPMALLDVAGPIRVAPSTLPSPFPGMIAFDISASNAMKFYDGTSWQTVATGPGSAWLPNGSDTYIMSGKVGIGISSPANLLDISTSMSSPAVASIENTSPGSASEATFLAMNNNFDYLQMRMLSSGFIGSYPSSSAVIETGAPNGLTLASNYVGIGGIIRFNTNSGVERMRIDNTGKVGIGTTSPGAGLHVWSNGFLVGNPTSGTPVMELRNCAGATGAGTTGSFTCSGIAVGSTVHCSPTATPSPATVMWSTYVGTAGVINFNFSTSASAMNWKCLVSN